MSVPAVSLNNRAIVFTASQLERRILTAALGLLPIAVVAVERIDRPESAASSPYLGALAVIFLVLALLLAAAYRYELRIDPDSHRYQMRVGFPLLSRTIHGSLADVERVFFTTENARSPRYMAMLDWRSTGQPAFCLGSSLDETAANALAERLAELALTVSWQS